MQPSQTFSLIYITCPDKASAEALAQSCIENKLAPCANIIAGMTAIYPWQGQITRAEEVVLLLKVPASAVADVMIFVKNNHPYDVPAIFEIPTGRVDENYAAWLLQAVAQHPT